MRRAMVAVGILLVLSLTALATRSGGESPRLVVGSTTSTQATALPGPTVVEAPPPTGDPVVPGAGGGSGVVGGGLLSANGAAYSPAIPFNSSIPVPTELQFMLVIGSDARPGENIQRTNGDSVHLIAVNPRTFEGTIVGFPRDAWVEIPGRGTGKLNSALAMGGPSLMVDTVRLLTGLPIQYYALTGFQGLERLVNDLGGVNVMVSKRMSDRFSGAFFEPGWHKFNGAQALAFTRNRYDAPGGDFGRSANHGVLIQAAMGKIRAEVGDDVGIRKWADVLLRSTALDVAPDKLMPLVALGRRTDPARMKNVVVPGRIGKAGRASVVYLTAEAAGLFTDLRADAVIGGETAPPPAATTATPAPAAATTTTQPTLTLFPPTTAPGNPGTTPNTLLPPITLFPPRP